MSQEQIDNLLEKCLAAYDAGLTPDECLASWPEQRHILEPLLRQAIMLRVAFSAAPGEEFRARVQAKVMFVAGREVKQAFAGIPDDEFRERLRTKVMFMAGREAREAFTARPDPSFVSRTRNRLRYAAGANAQEALRAVPPPRLPFWSNARRRLLEAASVQHRPAPARTFAFGMRAALSAAVLVLALGLGGVLYLTTQTHSSAASAELASLDQQVRQIEQQAAAGVPVRSDLLADLSSRTLNLADKVKTDQSLAPLADKLQPLIDRQQDVVNHIAPDTTTRPPALREVQQQLSQAEQQVRIAASAIAPAPQQQPTIAPASTAIPSPTPPPAVPTVVAGSGPLGPNIVRVTPLPNDGTFGLSWVELATDRFRATIPASWTLVGISPNAIGLAGLTQPRIQILGPNGAVVIIDTTTGEIDALVGGQALVLRAAGPSGKTISSTELVARAAPVARELYHLVETTAFVGAAAPAPTAVPARPTSTPTTAPPGATATAPLPTAAPPREPTTTVPTP